MSAAAEPAVTLHEVHRLLHHLPKLDPVTLGDVSGYGRAGDWLLWLARAQQGAPKVTRTRLAVFAGAHGCLPGSADATKALIKPLMEAQAPAIAMLEELDADLRVYELDLETPTADFTKGPALDEEAAAHAMSYGMMAVEPGLHLLALTGLGAGGEAAHKALLEKLPKADDALKALCETGGLEVCAMVGAILAARLAKLPVLLDGVAAETAAAVLARLAPEATLHCASVSALEPDLTDKGGIAAALALSRLRSLAKLA